MLHMFPLLNKIVVNLSGISTIYAIAICHSLGDYFLQTNYLATNKSSDRYLLFIHCLLYTAPFSLYFGFDFRIIILLALHYIIDSLKSRYKKFGIVEDQILHYAVAILCYVIM